MFETESTGLTSVFEGSEGYDCNIESFIVKPGLDWFMYCDIYDIVNCPSLNTSPEFNVIEQVALAVVIVTEYPPEPASAVPFG